MYVWDGLFEFQAAGLAPSSLELKWKMSGLAKQYEVLDLIGVLASNVS